MYNFLKITVLLMIGMLVSCKSQITQQELTIKVENNQGFLRNEVVEIPYEKLSGLLKSTSQEKIRVKKQDSQDYLLTQWIDNDSDGATDDLLFQAEVGANATVKYIVLIDSLVRVPKTKAVVFSRFVPERIDDFAWENDRVAFRTYGPEAQRLVEEGKEGGTLSSGIDLWLKKVNYSIIDSWYAKNVVAPGYYHIEHGEGYDPYHVGSSRGTGGTGIWENDSLYTSKNYTQYRVIATGPLRTIFELDYVSWSKYGVKETKRISLDLGSNFSKFENKIGVSSTIPNYTLGITLHKEKGVVALNAKNGIFRHWEPIDDSFVGEGIVIDPSVVKTAMDHRSKAADQSQILVVTAPKNDILTYYVGFAWTGSGQVQSVQDWDAMLRKQSASVSNPLKVKILK